MRKIYSESLWILVGQVVSVLGMLALVRLQTEILTPAEYGEFNLTLTLSGLFMQTLLGPIVPAVSRYWSIAHSENDVTNYLSASLVLYSLATILALLLGSTSAAVIYLTQNAQWTNAILLATILSVLQGASAMLVGLQNAARNRSLVALSSSVDVWLKVSAIAMLPNFHEPTVHLVLWCYTACSLLTLAMNTLVLMLRQPSTKLKQQSVSFKQSRQWLRKLWQYSLPFGQWGIFTWTQQSSDRWSLDKFASRSEVGAYAVIYQIGYVPSSLIVNLVVTVVGPILHQMSGDATDRERNERTSRVTWKLAAICLCCSVVAAIVAFFIHKALFRVLVAEEYRSQSYLLGFVVLAGGLFATGQLLALRPMSDMTNRSTVPIKIGSAIFGATANVLLAYLYGLEGIVAATLLFSTLYLSWMTVFLFRQDRRRSS